MTDLSKKILDQIKAKKIHPHSKLHFKILTWSLWAFLVILIVIASLSFGVSLHLFETADWDLQPLLTPSFSEFLFFTIPWFWLTVLLSVTLISIHFFKSTKQGHKITPVLIISSIIFLSLTGGGVIHATKISEKIGTIIEQKIPFMQKIHNPQNRFWQNPKRGFLKGRILEIPGTGHFTLQAFDDQIWNIDFPDFPPASLHLGQIIKLRGEMTEDLHFSATKFRGPDCTLFPDQNFCKNQPKPFQRLQEFFKPARKIK